MKKLLLAGILLASPAYAENWNGVTCARQESQWNEKYQTYQMVCVIEFNSTKPLPAPDDDNYPNPNIKKPDDWVYHTPTMEDAPRWLKKDCKRYKTYGEICR